MIDHLKADYPVRELCRIWDCSPSLYYARPLDKGDDQDVVAAIEHILMRYPYYGYGRVQQQLKREGLVVGERVVRHILRELGGRRQVGRVRVRTTDSRHPFARYPNRIKGVTASAPNQIWVAEMV